MRIVLVGGRDVFWFTEHRVKTRLAFLTFVLRALAVLAAAAASGLSANAAVDVSFIAAGLARFLKAIFIRWMEGLALQGRDDVMVLGFGGHGCTGSGV